MTTNHDFRHVPVAHSLVSRTFGLIGRGDHSRLFLLIPDCSSVHTWFMRSAIDVVFIDAQGTVAEIRPEARPFRILVGPSSAIDVLELPPGHAEVLSMRVGDRVTLPSG
ncbi:MAG: DUF192 domain-containing protein [Acidobacteriota bacterium]